MSKWIAWSLVLAAALCLTTGALAEEKPKADPEKSKAPKVKAKPKPKAKDFTLPDFNGKKHSLSGYKGKWVVLEWINHGCPFVAKHYKARTFQKMQKKYGEKGVIWLSICSSAAGKQGYFTATEWRDVNKKKGGLATAVLLDPKGTVGTLYGATRTPEMFVINPKGEIVYHGAIDDNERARRPEEIAKAKNYVDLVLAAVLAGKEAPVTKSKPYGCSVKYP